MKRSTLFIDESGKASLLQKGGEPFILTGVILEDGETQTVEGFFNYIKRKFEIPLTAPFHSYDIFESPKRKLADKKCSELIRTLTDFLSFIPIKIQILEMDTKLFRKSLGVRTDADLKGSGRKEFVDSPYWLTSSYLFKWFSEHLSETDQIGDIMVDARRSGDSKMIQALYRCKGKDGPFDSNTQKTINEKCTSICFAEKKCLSGGLEIADIISFVTFQNARRTMGKFKNIGLNSVWREIRKSLLDNKTRKINEEEIQSYFDIGADGVHKSLKKD